MAERKRKPARSARPARRDRSARSDRSGRTDRPARSARPARRKRADDNVIFVGQKPVMRYVLAVITQFSGGHKEIYVKARGRSISRAVDVAEVVRNKFLSDTKVKNIEIGTEEREVEGGNKINVSTMNILLAK